MIVILLAFDAAALGATATGSAAPSGGRSDRKPVRFQ